MAFVTVAAEGISDAAIADRLCRLCGHTPLGAHGLIGKPALDRGLAGYNQAARVSPWLALRDLDHDAECPAVLVHSLLPRRAAKMLLRVAVRSAEVWLLADRERIARYLSVPVARVPDFPEALERPKRALVDLARRSRNRSIREEMAPAAGRSTEIGPGYTARVIDFATRHWDPVAAAERSDSLARCIRALKTLDDR